MNKQIIELEASMLEKSEHTVKRARESEIPYGTYVVQINCNVIVNPNTFLMTLKEYPLVKKAKEKPEYYGMTKRNYIYKVEGLGGLAAVLSSMEREGIERIVVRCLRNGKKR